MLLLSYDLFFSFKFLVFSDQRSAFSFFSVQVSAFSVQLFHWGWCCFQPFVFLVFSDQRSAFLAFRVQRSAFSFFTGVVVSFNRLQVAFSIKPEPLPVATFYYQS